MFENRYNSIFIFLLLMIPLTGLAQDGRGGIEEPFSIGMGAKLLALGGAGGAAFPEDPSAVTWNPAAMGVVQQRGLGISHTTMPFGVQYNFLGYVHPTVKAGVFGIGLSRVGIDGIEERYNINNTPIDVGSFGYYWGKLSMGYGFKLYRQLSTGITFNAHRQVFGGISATNGFGVDWGLHWGSAEASGFFRQFYMGLSVSNVISRMKLGNGHLAVPSLFRFGLAKGFLLRDEADCFMILMDVDKNKDKEMRYHLGAEYNLDKRIFLRIGNDHDRITYGFGIRWNNFQLDYAIRQFGEEGVFDRSHRFSLIFHMGKSIPEQIRLAEEQRQTEFRQRMEEQLEAERSKRIQESLELGKQYLSQKDFFHARLEFTRVLREDENNSEASALLAEVEKEEQGTLKEREDLLVKQAAEKEKQRMDNAYVNRRFNQGLEALTKEQFQKAIELWQDAMIRDPNNSQIQSHIQNAQIELENKINSMIVEARRLMRQEKHSEAYKLLDNAKVEATGNNVLKDKVLVEIKRLDDSVDFLSFYQAGLQRYQREEYLEAAKFFEQALKINPDNDRVRMLYQNAVGRAKLKSEPDTAIEMGSVVRNMFEQGLDFYREGQYDSALKIWKEALELDPHNVKLLQAVQAATNRLETLKQKNE